MSEWVVPRDLRYDVNDYWVRSAGVAAEGSRVTVGLTAYGRDVIGDILYLDPPAEGSTVVCGAECGSLESGKWAGMLLAPIGGVVERVNPRLAGSLRVIGDDPYGEGWLFEIRLGPAGVAEFAALLTPAEYLTSIGAREALEVQATTVAQATIQAGESGE